MWRKLLKHSPIEKYMVSFWSLETPLLCRFVNDGQTEEPQNCKPQSWVHDSYLHFTVDLVNQLSKHSNSRWMDGYTIHEYYSLQSTITIHVYYSSNITQHCEYISSIPARQMRPPDICHDNTNEMWGW